ncbi:hypothetical protein [Luteolibacter soli]|uniref:Uncharacterized protein n=1 Tax=Luteolibacter soli TaxID=3135280 RepID=A0ABU9B0P1_9BACT
MALRFIQIFWGLLLVVLDFNINQIDILPDILGYILIALGCRGLRDASPRFSTAATLAWIMAILSVAGYAVRGNSIGFSLLSSAMDCAMMWFLLGGVMELANSRQRQDLSQRASSRRIAYVAIAALSTLIGYTIQSPGDGVVIGIALLIGMLVVLCLILHLIHRSIRELSDDPRW